jgi:hypothetical protein
VGHDFHIAIEPGKENHQPLDRKAIQSVIRESGNLWLIYDQPSRRVRLRISSSANDLIYFYGQSHIRSLVFSIAYRRSANTSRELGMNRTRLFILFILSPLMIPMRHTCG